MRHLRKNIMGEKKDMGEDMMSKKTGSFSEEGVWC